MTDIGADMKCKKCGGSLTLKIGWKSVKLRCMECGISYSIEDYINELDAGSWEKLSHRSCNRV